MKIKSIIALLAISGSAWAQKEIVIPPFTSIELNAPIHIQLIHDNTTKAMLNDANDKISFEVSNQVLHIERNGRISDMDKEVKVYFTEIKSVEINGAGQMSTASGTSISGEQLKLESNGAAKIDFSIDVKKLDLQATGASKITLKGKAEQVKSELDGATKLLAADLIANDFDMECNGAANFTIHVKNNLNVEASGASKGVYAGSPVNRKIEVNGIAKITDANTGDQMSDSRNQDSDTTRISLGKRKYIIIDESNEKEGKSGSKEGEAAKTPKTDRLALKHVFSGFEMGLNSFASPDLKLDIPAPYSELTCKINKSMFYGINILEGDVQIIKNKLAITSGLGIEFQNFEMGSFASLKPNVSGVKFDTIYGPLTKNKMYNFNFNVPLLVKFAPRNQKKRNGFHLAAGVIGTYKAHSHLIMENSAKGYEEKIKMDDDFNINPFRVSATVRVGYGWFRAFANYSLTPYFKQTTGTPDIRVFSAGLTLIPFQ